MQTDANRVCDLATIFATSFEVDPNTFFVSFETLLGKSDACIQVAEFEGSIVGYLLGFHHYTFFANGLVSWVEEIMVDPEYRHHGIGKQLMDEFERQSIERGSKLIALATRRAADFYAGLGYEDSATYFRKVL